MYEKGEGELKEEGRRRSRQAPQALGIGVQVEGVMASCETRLLHADSGTAAAQPHCGTNFSAPSWPTAPPPTRTTENDGMDMQCKYAKNDVRDQHVCGSNQSESELDPLSEPVSESPACRPCPVGDTTRVSEIH